MEHKWSIMGRILEHLLQSIIGNFKSIIGTSLQGAKSSCRTGIGSTEPSG